MYEPIVNLYTHGFILIKIKMLVFIQKLSGYNSIAIYYT